VCKEQVWYESVVAVNRYGSRGQLQQIVLYPIEMHWEGERDADRGIPRIAHGDDAQRILQRLQRLSAVYGTRIDIVGELGIISLA